MKLRPCYWTAGVFLATLAVVSCSEPTPEWEAANPIQPLPEPLRVTPAEPGVYL